MERYEDWCVVVALVGGGQEIHDGEAGLAEWGRALATREKEWKIWSSTVALHGGTDTFGQDALCKRPKLFNQSLGDAFASSFCNQAKFTSRAAHGVGGLCAASGCRRCPETCEQLGEFPIALVRDLNFAKRLLRRYGGFRISLWIAREFGS
jgi:hypothetical protein